MSLLIENCVIWPGAKGSVLVQDGVIAGVAEGGAPRAAADAQRIDAGGATLLPGLTDSHCHPFELGWLKRNVDLRGTANITAVRLRLAARVRTSKPGEWVQGMGWDQEAFPERRMPSRADIDDVSPDNPVIVSRICGHVGLVNSRALDVLGLEGAQGEEFERDPAGRLTGILKERALVRAHAGVPPQTADGCANDLLAAELEAARHGLCTLHCILSPDGFKEEIEALTALNASGKLSLRYRVYAPPEAIHHLDGKKMSDALGGVRVNGVKLFADGSLGARTAALKEPYSDDPGNRGLLRYSDEELESLVVEAHEEGYQVVVHAIGDAAVEQAIGALSAVTGGGNPRRHRIEHASLFPKDLRAKAKRASIRVAVQPSFITSDVWAESRLGPERVRDLYPLRSMMSEGLLVSGGSDAPVESINPVMGVWSAAVGAEYSPGETLGIEEALDLYVGGSASNGLDEATDGVIAEGRPANLTLLDSDISQLHPALLRKVGVSATVVGGKVVYSAWGTAR